MFKKSTYVLFLSSLFILISCKEANKGSLPIASGKLGSLVVVADQNVHKSMKDLIDSSFLKPLPQLPSVEPFFELLKPDFEDFQRFYTNQKSVLVLVDQENLSSMEDLLEPFSSETIEKLIAEKEPNPITHRNLFAKYQHIIYLFGKDANALKYKLRKCRDQLNSSLMSFELQDQNEKLFSDTSGNDKYFKMIQTELGLGVQIPANFNLKYHSNQTYWFEHLTQEADAPKTIALIVHAYPYKDSSDFSYESIRTVRDTTMKYLIKGEIAGTYMGTTESNFYPPIYKERIILNKNSGTKIKGWWTIRGMSQAGPYVRYVLQTPTKNKLFVFEGFVYKPNLSTKERDLRLIESIALSIK